MPDYVSFTAAEAFNHSRASAAYYYEDAGALSLASSGTRAYSYNGKDDGSKRGILIQPSVAQLYANVLDIAAWDSTVNEGSWSGTTAGPLGSTSMKKLLDSTASGAHFLSVDHTVDAHAQDITFSFFIKAAEHPGVEVRLIDVENSSHQLRAVVNASAGTITTSVQGTGIARASYMEALANGIYRATIVGRVSTNSNQATVRAQLLLRNAAGSSSFAGDGVSGVYLAAPNLHVLGTGTGLIGSSTTRAADYVSPATETPWYLSPAYTLEFHVRIPYAAGLLHDQVIYKATDGTTANTVRIFNPAGTTNIKMTLVSGGVTVFDAVIGTFTPGAVTGIAATIANNVMRGAVNGQTAVSVLTGNAPATPTVAIIGADDASGTKSLNGMMIWAACYPVTLDAAATQTLSNPGL